MLIRAEREEDRVAVRAVNESAFETSAEANLVAALRDQARPVISLVAEEAGAVFGHNQPCNSKNNIRESCYSRV